jgi:MerR family transcriptional regulator, light-induced transcriptional regulator
LKKFMAKDNKTPRHRSGAVAQMLHMPVATLRVWERRYQVSQAILTASGQRLYSPADVQRLALLKQLTDLGHAIGSLAALDMPELLEVAATHADAENVSQVHRPAPAMQASGAWRVAVIGPALARRLQRPALLRHLKRTLVLLGPFDNAAQADEALQGVPVDALLVHEPSLHPDWLARLHAGAPTLRATPKALLYGFAADATCEALAQAGVVLLREPQNDTVLAQWLQNLLFCSGAATVPAINPSHAKPTPTSAPRRWSDAALAEFVSQSPTIACECGAPGAAVPFRVLQRRVRKPQPGRRRPAPLFARNSCPCPGPVRTGIGSRRTVGRIGAASLAGASAAARSTIGTMNENATLADIPATKEPRLWQDNGWTARVIKNEDDEGWAVEMIKDGEPEPALVGPWTMGRDKKNPKPLDTAAFNTLVKTACEVVRRHEQAEHARLHKNIGINTDNGRITVSLDLVPDEDDPHALLSATNALGEPLAEWRVPANFKLNVDSATAWIDGGLRKPL